MAEASIVEEGVERFREAFGSLDGEFQRVQKRIQTGRKSLEKQLKNGRRDFERQTRKQVKKLQAEARKSPVMKRARSFQSDATQTLEKGFDRVLGVFQIATRSDINRIDRKLNQINRKLKDIERARRSNGGASTI